MESRGKLNSNITKIPFSLFLSISCHNTIPVGEFSVEKEDGH
jgi:hypothetical protein